jgi:hypothetical protein
MKFESSENQRTQLSPHFLPQDRRHETGKKNQLSSAGYLNNTTGEKKKSLF